MNDERFLLETGCKYSTLAYDEEVKKGIKIESRLTSTTAYVVKTKTLDIICFRGTQQLGDWLFNISAIPVPYAGRLCHGGFVAAHASVWRKIKKHIDYDKDTLVCGHSLGGATSILLASTVPEKVRSVYTFGAPPLSSLEFKKYYRSVGLSSKTFRYTTPRDPVVNLIPIYHHIGNKILLPYESKSRLQHHDIETYQMLLEKMGIKNIKSIICVTSDKCYSNNYSTKGFKEGDHLGGCWYYDRVKRTSWEEKLNDPHHLMSAEYSPTFRQADLNYGKIQAGIRAQKNLQKKLMIMSRGTPRMAHGY